MYLHTHSHTCIPGDTVILQVVDQRKLDKVDAKLKSKLEKKALRDMEEGVSAMKRYAFGPW